MRMFLFGMFAMAVIAVGIFLMDGAMSVNFSLNVSYNNIHDAIDLASK